MEGRVPSLRDIHSLIILLPEVAVGFRQESTPFRFFNELGRNPHLVGNLCIKPVTVSTRGVHDHPLSVPEAFFEMVQNEGQDIVLWGDEGDLRVVGHHPEADESLHAVCLPAHFPAHRFQFPHSIRQAVVRFPPLPSHRTSYGMEYFQVRMVPGGKECAKKDEREAAAHHLEEALPDAVRFFRVGNHVNASIEEPALIVALSQDDVGLETEFVALEDAGEEAVESPIVDEDVSELGRGR